MSVCCCLVSRNHRHLHLKQFRNKLRASLVERLKRAKKRKRKQHDGFCKCIGLHLAHRRGFHSRGWRDITGTCRYEKGHLELRHGPGPDESDIAGHLCRDELEEYAIHVDCMQPPPLILLHELPVKIRWRPSPSLPSCKRTNQLC